MDGKSEEIGAVDLSVSGCGPSLESRALTNLCADYYCLVLPILEEPLLAGMLPLTNVDGAKSDTSPKTNNQKSRTIVHVDYANVHHSKINFMCRFEMNTYMILVPKLINIEEFVSWSIHKKSKEGGWP